MTKFFPPKINWKTVSSEVKPPRLVEIYRTSKIKQRPAVPNVANAPFGIQKKVVLDVIGDNAVDGKAFIYPLQKLVFNYCDAGGSSRGIKYV
jgi:hypothetical protein